MLFQITTKIGTALRKGLDEPFVFSTEVLVGLTDFSI